MALQDGDAIYFYELHEGDDEVFADLLLAHDSEFDEAEFLEIVLEARAAIVETFEEDTLVEALGVELQKRHGFLPITDAQLRVSVNVSVTEGDTQVVSVDAGRRPRDEDRDDEGFRSLLIETESEDRPYSDN
ncbi:MAG: hypothetical protein ABIZ34_03590 [Candidatus Limnocylindrales bacterium]